MINCIESSSVRMFMLWEATKTIQRETQQRWEELKQFRRQLKTKSSMRKQQTLSQSTCHFNLNLSVYINFTWDWHTQTHKHKIETHTSKVAIYKRRLIVQNSLLLLLVQCIEDVLLYARYKKHRTHTTQSYTCFLFSNSLWSLLFDFFLSFESFISF